MLDRLTIAGWGGILGIGAWAVYELLWQPPVPVAAVTTENPNPVSIELPELEVVPIELDDLRITLDRPLFSVSRRPVESTPVAGVSEPTESAPAADAPLRLSAVIVDAQGRSALLEPFATKVVQRVQEGQEIAGWRLVEVREDAVVLAAGGNRTELPLRVFGAPPPPAKKRASRKQPDQTPTRTPGSVNSQAAQRAAKQRAAKLEQTRRARRENQ